MTTLTTTQSDLLDITGVVYSSEAVALTGGGYMLTAHVFDQSNGGGAQKVIDEFFDASGNLVNTVTPGSADGMAAALFGGNVVTAVEGLNITIRTYTPAGQQVGNSTNVAPPNDASTAHDPGGITGFKSASGYVVTFSKAGAGSSMFSPTHQLFFQTDFSGTPVAITSASEGNSDTASVASMTHGAFVAGWNAYGSAFAQVFSHSTGVGVSGVINLGPTSASSQAPVPTAAGLADNTFVVEWLSSDGMHIQHFNTSGAALDTPIVIAGASLTSGGFMSGSQTDPAIAALPDGGYVATWIQTNADGTTQVEGEHFDGSDQAVGAAFAVSDATIDIKRPSVAVGPNGMAFFSWGDYIPDPAGHASQGHIEGRLVDPAAPAPPPSPPTGEQLQASGGPVTLSTSSGWTGATVLSNHALAVVAATAGDYGSHTASEQTYDSSGAETGSAQLMGYAGAGQSLTPQIAALADGYYQVNYAGSSNYEVYNAADQRVFVHNAYTSQTAAVTPLSGGGYVETDPNSNVFGVFDANNNAVAWDSYAPGSTGNPTVRALADGAFVFTYAGSREIESYDATGHLLSATGWGQPVQNYAMGFASLGQSGFLGAWIGGDVTPGPDAGQTAILIEPFFNDGATITHTLTLTQDLDPWHTQFNLQSHADGSVAILWSEGGGIFGAEYGGGSATTAHAAVAGDLSSVVITQLPNDQVGLAWLQGGDVWAELFDPATGAVQRADLGATTGDLSTVHALATANGGMAVSWRDASGVEAAVLSASGQLGSAAHLPGDLLGVDAAGHAITLHDQGGTPVLQAFTLSDGLFWVH